MIIRVHSHLLELTAEQSQCCTAGSSGFVIYLDKYGHHCRLEFIVSSQLFTVWMEKVVYKTDTWSILRILL